jgi:iron(II)-dependent oxidoreductase
MAVAATTVTARTSPAAAGTPDPREAIAALEEVRRRTLALVAPLSEEQLERVHSPIMSPLVWDLGHVAAYEDLWLAHRHAGLELLRPELAQLYDAFETPRAVRGEIEALGPADARAYLEQVRARVRDALAARGVGDGIVYELVLRHELQHTETMRQTMAIAGLLPAGEPPLGALDGHDLAGHDDWVEIPAGSFELGAGPQGFAYDNERPRHSVELGAFQIARHPVGNASWMHFSEGGGYERREWWSDEGWAWKEEYDITHHPAIAAGDPDATPVCHVSWFEADAFARAHGARLPSEAEWERAATWNREGDGAGEGRGSEGVERRSRDADVRAGLAGVGEASAGAGLAGIGLVWEWTDSRFGGYPGFRAHPYREYSEVFFGEDYRVLRGGSWATHPRVKTATFRNWDLPQRRQIFAGVRLARDVA